MSAADLRTHAWTVQSRLEADDRAITVVVSGRLGTSGAPQLADALAAAISGGGHVQLDLSGVDYISSAGLAVLREAATTLRDRGGRLAIVAASDLVKLTLDLAGEALRTQALGSGLQDPGGVGSRPEVDQARSPESEV